MWNRQLIILGLAACAPEPEDQGAAFSEGPFVVGEAQVCDAPMDVSYRAVTLDVPFVVQGGGLPTEGGQVAVADLDQDGELDLVFPRMDGENVLGWGLGEGRFEWVGFGGEGGWQPTLVDLNLDGQLELILTGKPGFLLVHFHGREFVETQYFYEDGDLRELSAGDLDGDGWPDLFPVVRGDPEDPQPLDSIWVAGEGSFTEVQGLLPAGLRARQGFDGLWFDYEGDGDLDFFLANDLGRLHGGNQLFVNEGGALVEVSEAPATDLALDSMAGDAADFDRDGVADLYVTCALSNQLLQGLPDGGFVDVGLARGAQPITHGWGMAWAGLWLDHDNDDALDLLVAQGDLLPETGDTDALYEAPVHLLRQTDAGFEERGPALGLPVTGSHRAAVAVDFNDDGVLDLLLTHNDAPPELLLSEGCGEGSWLEIEAPLGSELVVEGGGRTWVEHVDTDSSYGAAKPPIVHLGLGEVEVIDRVTLHYAGTSDSLFGPLSARRRLTAAPGPP
ncbi:MAG: CRTAC1 family protein [Alphaproteobacteria bacterium]|nr:CRTAC1 family protein [Alphaproteobacteria bacterium]